MAVIIQKPIPCREGDGGRKYFVDPFLQIILTVPDMSEEFQIRQLLDAGNTLKEAYEKVRGTWEKPILPVAPMQPCVEDILREKVFNAETGKYEIAAFPYQTCLNFKKCFEQYVRATKQFPDKPKGRMEIVPGVYAPGSTEERCIRLKFHHGGDIVKAYTECGAIDIMPDWAGVMETITTALTTKAGADLYHVIKMAYMATTVEPEPEPIPPVIHEPTADVVKVDWMFILAVAGVVYLASRR